MKIKRGNYTELTIGPLCDEDDAAITDLDDALTVDFYVKRNRDDDNDDAVIHKGLDDGITIDSPAEGSMVIVLIDTDTAIPP